jgi:type II secretory pathway component PulF
MLGRMTTGNPYAAPQAEPPPNEGLATAPQAFTGLDWVALAVAGFAILGLLAFPVGRFAAMFRDFDAALPPLTRFVLLPWSRVVMALPAVACLALGFRARHRPSARRTWFAVAFVVGFLAAVLCLIAMYLPIFAIAEAIKAE